MFPTLYTPVLLHVDMLTAVFTLLYVVSLFMYLVLRSLTIIVVVVLFDCVRCWLFVLLGLLLTMPVVC